MLGQIHFHQSKADSDVLTTVNLAQVKNWRLWDTSVNRLVLIEEWGVVRHLEVYVKFFVVEYLFALA